MSRTARGVSATLWAVRVTYSGKAWRDHGGGYLAGRFYLGRVGREPGAVPIATFKTRREARELCAEIRDPRSHPWALSARPVRVRVEIEEIEARSRRSTTA